MLRSNESFLFREEVEEFFDFMDRDFDGRLSFEEFMGEESTIEKLFKNMDKNGDGFVTKQVAKDSISIFAQQILNNEVMKCIFESLQSFRKC